MICQQQLKVLTRGRGSYDITGQIKEIVSGLQAKAGICHVFVQHTSASLMLCENADPVVRQDLEAFMADLVPDGSPLFRHTDEGPDDMPAHVRSVLTQPDLNIPVQNSRCLLGTWQGIYLWEHRTLGHQRTVIVTVNYET